jgi:NAD(P)-dependent dehydrogenase (short-subunit alcohol dehydrogenase family)
MRIFITGSSDGLGQMAALELVRSGHEVVLHARNPARAKEALRAVPGASHVVCADLASIEANRRLAAELNDSGAFDAVIHNAAVGYREPRRIDTTDGLPHVFAINTLSPFILTACMTRPKRLVYLSSGLHRGGDVTLCDLAWANRRWDGTQAYSDSKLHDAILAFAVARYWHETFANALEPGWVATKMGGAGASDDLSQGATTQVWLAGSHEPAALVSGKYFYHMRQKEPLGAVRDATIQDQLLAECERLSGISMPRS